jgi:hypothetical protein
MKTALLVLVWSMLLLAAGGVALRLWLELDGVSLGLHGWLALGLGVGLSLALGVGLMALVFHSARRGYDDAAVPPGGGAPGDAPPERVPPGRRQGDDAQR